MKDLVVFISTEWLDRFYFSVLFDTTLFLCVRELSLKTTRFPFSSSVKISEVFFFYTSMQLWLQGILSPLPFDRLRMCSLAIHQMYSWIVSFMSIAVHNTIGFIFVESKIKANAHSYMLFKSASTDIHTRKTQYKYVHVKVLNFLRASQSTFSWTSVHTKGSFVKDVFLSCFEPKQIIIIPNPPLFRSSLSTNQKTMTIFNNRCELNHYFFSTWSIQAVGYAS